MAAVITVANARAATGVVTQCRKCEQDLFGAVVRCPYCGTRRTAQAMPTTLATNAETPDETATKNEKSTQTINKPIRKAHSAAPGARLWGLSRPAIATISLVILLVLGLYAAEFVEDGVAKPRQTIMADTNWQALAAPPGARITANGPFRLRSGPDLYTITIDNGVAIPPPGSGETLEVRAVNGSVTLTIAY